jgi:hypothetical protein
MEPDAEPEPDLTDETMADHYPVEWDYEYEADLLLRGWQLLDQSSHLG